MAETVRNINQTFRSYRNFPELTVRTTQESIQGYKSHWHNEFSIGVILSGSTCLTIADSPVILSQGDVVLIEPELVHSCNPVDNRPRSYHMLYLDKIWCCNVLSGLFGYQVTDFSCDQIKLSGCSHTRSLAESLTQLMREPEEVANVQSIKKVLYDLLSRYCSPCQDQSLDTNISYQTKRLLIEGMSNPPDLKSIASSLGFSQEGLIRNFKRCYGITPKAFLNNHRIEMAKLMLKSGINIIDVAGSVGFSDQSQLHRAFVNYTASTPRQYQQGMSIFDNKS